EDRAAHEDERDRHPGGVSAPPPQAGADGALRTRVLNGLAIFLAAMLVLWVGLPLLAPAFVFLSLVALSEYAELMRLRGVPVRKRSLYVAAVLTLPASLPSTYPGMPTLRSEERRVGNEGSTRRGRSYHNTTHELVG